MTTAAAAAAEEAPPPSSTPAPASPPLPTRHTAATPGVRAARFQELYATSLARTLARVSWDNFAACYPTVAARAPGALKTVQTAMVERLGELCQREFDLIVQKRAVIPKLNELESLSSNAARRRHEQQDRPTPVPPHLLPPDAIMAAHMAPHLAAHQSVLAAKLQATRDANAALFVDIEAQRAEAKALLAALDRALADVEAANGLLSTHGDGDDLGRESKEVDAEMAVSL